MALGTTGGAHTAAGPARERGDGIVGAVGGVGPEAKAWRGGAPEGKHLATIGGGDMHHGRVGGDDGGGLRNDGGRLGEGGLAAEVDDIRGEGKMPDAKAVAVVAQKSHGGIDAVGDESNLVGGYTLGFVLGATGYDDERPTG